MRIVRAQKHEAIRYQHSEFRKYRENNMSILNVEHLSHGFGDRAIFDDVSFRYPDGEEEVLSHFSLKIPAGTTSLSGCLLSSISTAASI